MKAQIEEVNSVQRRIKVELSEQDVNNAFDAVYRNLRKKARIRGFRPGKAPLQVLRKFYGNSVAVDVADRLVRDHLFSAIQDQSLQPIAAPVLETAELPSENTEYAFSALIDILPALSVEGYKGLELTYTPSSVDEAAVERELEMLQRRQSKTKDAAEDATAGDGFIATISQKAKLDGEDFAAFTFEKVPVELGKQYMLQEIEDQVVGMKTGESKEFKLKIPENFHEKDLVGKDVDCTVTVEQLQELILPELNDEFAKDLGLEDLETLKKNIRDGLERQAEQSKRNQLETAMLDQLSEKNDFDVPPSMVDQVIDSMFDEMNFESDEERKQAKKDEQRRKGMRDNAKQRAKNTLILSEIIKAEEIKVTDEDVDEHVRSMLQSSGQGDDIEPSVLDSIKKSMGGQVKESLLFKKAIDFVIESGTVTEKSAG